MKNVIKAQLYQLSKNRMLFIVLIGINLICLLFAFLFSVENGVEYIDNTGSSFAANLMMLTGTFAAFIPPVTASMICAGDFTDKTSNNEITSGTMRKDVYFGRVVLSLIISLIFTVITISLPIIVISAMYGWGDTVPLWSVIERIAASLVPMFKSTCFCILLSFIIKKPSVVILGYFVVGRGIVSAIAEFGGMKITDGLFSSYDIMSVLSYKSYTTYGLNDDKQVWTIYTYALETDMLVKIAVCSIIMGIAFLYAGYYYHKKDDLN